MDDHRRYSPRFQGDNFDENLKPIPATKHRRCLEQNVGALEVRLSDQDLKELDDIFPKDAAAGLRHPREMMGVIVD